MKQRKILVVDDEKNIRLMLSQTLASDDTDVETAINAEEALQKLEQASYDVVLLDLRMPGMDGLEALQWLHAQDPKVPVILLTAHGSVDSAVAAMRGGAVDFLQKPFSPREIREAVDNAINQRASADTKTDPQQDDATANRPENET